MKMDSKAPSIPYRDYVQTETRFSMLWHTHPEVAERLLEQEQQFVNQRYHYYRQLSQLDWSDGDAVAQAKANKRSQVAAPTTEGGQ
jgi:pyruvate-ferredoxin/flavodoxin oxidoreductase